MNCSPVLAGGLAMPRKRYSGHDCAVCGTTIEIPTEGVTCSAECRARLREARKTREWRTKKVYPDSLVNQVRDLYAEHGMSQEEVADHLGIGFRVVQRVMENHDIPRRRKIKRDQRGTLNSSWRGDLAGYEAVHLRLAVERGKAADQKCVDCGGRAGEWSYRGGAPGERNDANTGCPYSTDLDYYEPRCVLCHRRHDAKVRRFHANSVR